MEIKPNFYYIQPVRQPRFCRLIPTRLYLRTISTYLMAYNRTSNAGSLHTQNYNAHITINVRIHRFKSGSPAASTLIFSPTRIKEVSAIWSWRPNQTLLSARSNFLSGQWSHAMLFNTKRSLLGTNYIPFFLIFFIGQFQRS